MLVHGNMLKDEALALNKVVETIIDPKPLTPEELKSHRALIVPEGKSYGVIRIANSQTVLTRYRTGKYLRRVQVANAENNNSALEQFTYVGDIYNDLERAKLSVFATIVQEPLFDVLRAKEQLGYIVSRPSRRSDESSQLTMPSSGLEWFSPVDRIHGTACHRAEREGCCIR